MWKVEECYRTDSIESLISFRESDLEKDKNKAVYNMSILFNNINTFSMITLEIDLL